MTREEEIRARYEKELRELHFEQASCSHEWGEVVYDPEIIKVPRYEPKWVGVDCWPEIVGYTEEKEDRWSRTCKKCGKVEYTKEQVPVEPVRYVPHFN